LARKIVVFEGIDRTGKTTQAQLLENRLIKSGIKAKIFNFGNPKLLNGMIGKARRDRSLFELPQKVQILLVAADFYYCLEKIKKYKGIIILDRYLGTVFASHIPKGISAEWIQTIYQDAPRPDVIILLDASAEEMAKRKSEDVNALDIENQNKAREIYLRYFRNVKINALLSIAEVYEEVWQKVKSIVSTS
jgi:dTMP kinase